MTISYITSVSASNLYIFTVKGDTFKINSGFIMLKIMQVISSMIILFLQSLSPFTFITLVFQFIGYIIFSSFLQYYFYFKKSQSYKQWKVQASPQSSGLSNMWGFPIVSSKPNRGKFHGVFTCFNLCMASIFVAATTEWSVKGWNRMRFNDITSINDCLQVVLEFVWIVCWQCIIEYYWHRMMHLPFFYKLFHKFHHHYKAPEPWDDMYIHPVEACGYYCILYSPPFLFSTHIFAFLAYMAVMGTFGVLDHSGIKIVLPGLYDTAEHDRHHEKFEVNYSFPFPHMDILHGTFDGEFWGRNYKSSRRKD